MTDLVGPPCCSRRGFGGLLLGAAAAAFASPLTAQTAREPAIDVHHHLLPPFYKPYAEPELRRYATNVDDILAWTPERSIAAMDAAGVERSILSISTPGVAFHRGAADAELARKCNDYAAGLMRAFPGRFGFFAVLPADDWRAASDEARRAIEELGASGVALLSSYQGRYLGDPAFAPLFEALARTPTLVYVHPTLAPCCAGLLPDVADPLIELPVDTGRTIASLLWSGALSRHPNLRWVFSHGGGILPMVMERVGAMGFVRPELRSRVPEGVTPALSKLFVDTASVANPAAMGAIRSWLPDSQILFGTDFPWGRPDQTLAALDRLNLPRDTLAGIRRGNALALLRETPGTP